jgi:hypothetical protein
MKQRTLLAVSVCIGLLCGLGGCESVAYVANVVAGDDGDPPPITVTGEYDGLANQKVGVIVAAGPDIEMRFPTAGYEVSTVISQRIADNVPGAVVLDPKQIEQFKLRNIYWTTNTPSDIAEALGVDRLVYVDLDEYRIREPGNSVMFMGVINARMQVFESDGPTPDDAAYATVVGATYPRNAKVGVPEADPNTIRLGVLDQFSRAAAGKFYEHEEPRN